MEEDNLLNSIKGGIIVSCQALKQEPLHSSYIMSRMAYAAMVGGAVGIRANGGEDIKRIKETVSLPVIGLVKALYDASSVYITPTLREAKEAIRAGADILAMDATDRKRPGIHDLKELAGEIRRMFPGTLLMGDVSKLSEGIYCEELGFDLVSTTLCGYTDETRGRKQPDLELMRALKEHLSVPVVAEGGIWTPEDVEEIMELGVHSIVIGTAITRPAEITKRFVKAAEKKKVIQN